MPSQKRRDQKTELTFADAIAQMVAVLDADQRAGIVGGLLAEGDDALDALRRAMRSHTFESAAGSTSLRRMVDSLDARTRKEGLHVIHGWDYTTHKRPAEIAPVLLLDYCVRIGVSAERTPVLVPTLLDQYWLALLMLFVVRAWDEGDANVNLDQVTALIATLNGEGGCGHPVVDDAESLLMLAVAYFHPEEHAYDDLLAKVWTLDHAHALRVAFPAASILGSHLRWGLRFMYQKDVGRMRADNIVDYPWVLFSLVTLMREYERLHSAGAKAAARVGVVGALLDGLSADPWAFTGKLPSCLSGHQALHDELRASLMRHRGELLTEFGEIKPGGKTFSPMGVGCNFLSNAAVAIAAITVSDDARYPSLNALFSRERPGDQGTAESLARRLMEYASDPARLGAGGAPLIVYDPYDSVHYYNTVVRTLSEAPS